jgi:hypothetical protein
MKEVIKSVFSVLLIIYGLLTFLFYRGYQGNSIPYPFFWLITGILSFGAGFLILKLSSNSLDEKFYLKRKKELEDFKSTAEVIKVNLNNCTIKTNNYTQEVLASRNYRVQALNTVLKSEKNVEFVNFNQSVLIFETTIFGQKKLFRSETIFKDEITLRFLLDFQKETNIYIDKQDSNDYYFDTEFLY